MVPEIGDGNQFSEPLRIRPYLSIFDNAASLREFVLYIPRVYWDDDSMMEMSKIFSGKPLLRDIKVNFHGYMGDSEDLLGFLVDFLRGRSSLSGLQIRLMEIGDVDEDCDPFRALQRYRSKSGETCLTDDSRGGWKFVLH